jgi:hypothetical protein
MVFISVIYYFYLIIIRRRRKKRKNMIFLEKRGRTIFLSRLNKKRERIGRGLVRLVEKPAGFG